eukprot:512700-Pleurochrysis_carterae.AAC.1
MLEQQLLTAIDTAKKAYSQPPTLTPEETTSFMQCDTCIYCQKEFDRDCKSYDGSYQYDCEDLKIQAGIDVKVVDHCHYTNRYRGPAHRS